RCRLPHHVRVTLHIFTVHQLHTDDPPGRLAAGRYRAGVALGCNDDVDRILSLSAHRDREFAVVRKPGALLLDLPGSVATGRARLEPDKTRAVFLGRAEDPLERA